MNGQSTRQCLGHKKDNVLKMKKELEVQYKLIELGKIIREELKKMIGVE